MEFSSRETTAEPSLNSYPSKEEYEKSQLPESGEPRNDWRLVQTVRDIQQNDPAGVRRLGLTWSNLTVRGVSASARMHENNFSQFNIGTFIRESRAPKQMKTIIDNSSGCVKPGEMLLVLGRPGAGCTTLLKMLANRRNGLVPSNCHPNKSSY